jgi:ankyrin repeat protein
MSIQRISWDSLLFSVLPNLAISLSLISLSSVELIFTWPTKKVTPMIMAAQQGHLEVVKLLVERGAVVDQPRHDGSTALPQASFTGHLEVVDFPTSTICAPKEYAPCMELLRKVISRSSSSW